MKRLANSFGVRELLQLLFLAAVLLAALCYIVFRTQHLGSPSYSVASHQALSQVCTPYRIILPEEDTIPLPVNDYQVRLESQYRHSSSTGYVIQASESDGGGQLITWSAVCSQEGDDPANYPNRERYQGVPIHWTYSPVEVRNGKPFQGVYALVVLDGFLYRFSADLQGASEDCRDALLPLLMPAAQSVIAQSLAAEP